MAALGSECVRPAAADLRANTSVPTHYPAWVVPIRWHSGLPRTQLLACVPILEVALVRPLRVRDELTEAVYVRRGAPGELPRRHSRDGHARCEKPECEMLPPSFFANATKRV